MRKRFEPQLTLGCTSIEQIIIPTNRANYDNLLRQMLGVHDGIIRGRNCDMQNIKDNVSFLGDATLRNINKLLTSLFFFFIPFILSAQHTVSGYIFDAETGNAIQDAHIFIANTTIGATTSDNGSFFLKIPGDGSYRIAVSHVAYEPVFVEFESGKSSKTLDIKLRMLEFGAVEVALKVKVRNMDKDLFWKTLLGKKPSKNTIYAINPEAVYYYYNSETQKLTVTCRQPLQIINNETGYHIQYVLDRFIHNYKNNLSSWEGECVFEELEPKNYKQKNTWKKNRQKIYKVSVNKFVKSLYNHSLKENGFLLTHSGELWVAPVVDPDLRSHSLITKDQIKSSPTKIHTNNLSPLSLPDPKNYLSSGANEGYKTLYIPPDSTIVLVCFGKPITDRDLMEVQFAQNRRTSWSSIGSFRNRVLTPEDTIRIYPDGTFRNSLRFSTWASSQSLTGLNMILPIEYDSGMNVGTNDKNNIEQNENEELANQTLVNTLNRTAKRFDTQLSVFPQEKVYLHTDKPYYISGERIWFRAHVVDAASHTATYEANCVFTELFDVRDSVISRVKSGLINGAFSGFVPIPDDVPEGNYTLRAYTNTMRDLDEDYFFLKNIYIGNPMTHIIQASTEFEFLKKNKIDAEVRFFTLRPFDPSSPHPTPESVKIGINSGKLMNVNCTNGISGISFKLLPNEKQRVMLLDASYNQKSYRQYIRIPLPDEDFEVTFYPEGGSALYGSMGRIAFKAMQSDGTEIDVSGIVYDWRGNEITRFQTDVRGMGQFFLTPLKDEERYYSICTNSKGQSKQFELPVANGNGYALTTGWNKDHLIVKIRQPESRNYGDTLCLIVHTRGVVQDVLIWENIKEPVAIHQSFFPSGVSNLLLLTKDMIPVSERLVFVNNNDQSEITLKTDRNTYPVRSQVEYTVTITDELGGALEGSLSVSVTDNHEVIVDTTANILTELLLTSDLRGYIHNPAFYFQKNTKSAWALDLLMLTQGWRRYNTEQIVRNNFMFPDSLNENGYEISGKVEEVKLRRKKPVANASVSILSVTSGFYATTETDHNGRFYLHDGNASDSTWFIVQKNVRSAKDDAKLTLYRAFFPIRTVPVVSSNVIERNVFDKYADKAEQQYVDEHGVRVTKLREVVISAKKKPVQKSVYYQTADRTVNVNELKIPPSTMNNLLLKLPGVSVSEADGRLVAYIARFSTEFSDEEESKKCPAMYLIDDLPSDDVSWLNPMDIEQIDLLTSPSNLNVFTGRGRCGVIAIHTKTGSGGAKTNVKKSYDTFTQKIMPLGFQKPTEFYAPKYDQTVLSTKPDLRTTIHWQPNLVTDETGTASFSFYTADTSSTYTVVIEGVTEDGKIVYKRDKIVVGGQ